MQEKPRPPPPHLRTSCGRPRRPSGEKQRACALSQHAWDPGPVTCCPWPQVQLPPLAWRERVILRIKSLNKGCLAHVVGSWPPKT